MTDDEDFKPTAEFIARIGAASDIRPIVAESLTDDRLDYAAAIARTWAMNGDEYHGHLFGQVILAARWWRNGVAAPAAAQSGSTRKAQQ